MTGWDLSEAAQATIGYFWNVTRSQVYRELHSLEAQGLVVGGERGTREKRAYTITEAGRAAFADWISQEPGPLVARFPLLVTVWFGDHLSDDSLDFFLRLHRARHEKRREFLHNLVEEVDDHSAPGARVARFGLMFEEMVLGWFDSLSQFGGVEERGEHPGEPRPSKPRRPGDFGEEPPSLRKRGRGD
jgi:DNA-binding PadR family transcriptional regulator